MTRATTKAPTMTPNRTAEPPTASRRARHGTAPLEPVAGHEDRRHRHQHAHDAERRCDRAREVEQGDDRAQADRRAQRAPTQVEQHRGEGQHQRGPTEEGTDRHAAEGRGQPAQDQQGPPMGPAGGRGDGQAQDGPEGTVHHRVERRPAGANNPTNPPAMTSTATATSSPHQPPSRSSATAEPSLGSGGRAAATRREPAVSPRARHRTPRTRARRPWGRPGIAGGCGRVGIRTGRAGRTLRVGRRVGHQASGSVELRKDARQPGR